ncbi:MAG: hypothetical protein ACLFQM_07070 [Fidelibacterota bacterium]
MLIIAAFFLKINITIKTTGKILAAEQLRIIRKLPDSIELQITQQGNPGSNQTISHFFERGGFMQFNLDSSLMTRNRLSKQELIGRITSERLDYEITRLNNQIREEKATLKSLSSGEKASVIEEAKKMVNLKQIKFSEQQVIVERMRKLRESKLVSRQEFELATNLLDIYEAQLGIAKANLQTVQSGAKPENIKIVKDRIEGLQQEMTLLQRKKHKQSITAPFSGRVEQNVSSDTLLTLYSDEKIVLIPVELSEVSKIQPGQVVGINSPELSSTIKGRIFSLQPSVQRVSGKQIIFVHCRIPDTEIPVNTFVKCNIRTGRKQIIKMMLTKIKQIEIN